jgi:iron complex outermembrane recepter protein
MKVTKIGLLATAAMSAIWSMQASGQTPVPVSSDKSTEARQDESQADAAAQDIVVTGVRASIQRAQELKRQAPSVIEAITAQDIGKFTDSSVADALQRIPGVTIDRNYRGQDQGDGVNIRGLGRAYVQTTVNGRELLGSPDFFGGSGRNFDFGSIPPDILGSILIYKTPTAGIVESGLAGEVDQRTIRPLEIKRGNSNIFGSLTAAAFYDPKSAKLSPQLSGVVGTKLLDGTLGLYIAGVHSREKAETDQFFNYAARSDLTIINANGSTTTLPGINVVNGFGARRQQQNYKRDAIAAGAQWKPNDSTDMRSIFFSATANISVRVSSASMVAQFRPRRCRLRAKTWFTSTQPCCRARRISAPDFSMTIRSPRTTMPV